MRTFWLFPKKRRRRRTGSDWAGGLALSAFSAACLVGGLGFLWWIAASLLLPEWRVNRAFQPVECRVIDTKLEENDDEAGVSYRPRVLVRYVVDGRAHQVWTYDIAGVYSADRQQEQAALDRFAVGQTVPGWYDPAAPETAVLVRGYTWFAWLLLLLPASFITVGGGGLVYTLLHWGKSAERRAATAPLPAALELLEPAAPVEEPVFPTIPHDGHLTNSPGTRLRFRLPSRSHPLWRLGFLSALAAVVDLAAGLFSWMAAHQILAGTPDWFLALFCLPWITVGAIATIKLVRQAWFQARVGQTIVEISDHPLVLGERYLVLLSQSGRLVLKSLRMLVVCQEQATYQQGTNTRTYSRRVFERQLVGPECAVFEPGQPAEIEAELELPEGAMHTFRGEHNEIAWSLVVRGELESWPPFEHAFPIIIYPAGAVLQRR